MSLFYISAWLGLELLSPAITFPAWMISAPNLMSGPPSWSSGMAKTLSSVGYKTPTHIQLVQLLWISSGIIITQRIQSRNQHVILSDVVHDAVDDEHAVHAGVLPHPRLPRLLLPGVWLGPRQPLCPPRSPCRAEGQDPRLPPPARRPRQLHHQDDRQTQQQGGRARRVDEGGRGLEEEGGGGGEGGAADRPLQVLEQGGDPAQLSLWPEANGAAQ